MEINTKEDLKIALNKGMESKNSLMETSIRGAIAAGSLKEKENIYLERWFSLSFRNALRCGFGEYMFARYKYKGFYDNDKKFGYGEYYYNDNDGKIYKGNFFEDKKHGEGEVTMPDGTTLK